MEPIKILFFFLFYERQEDDILKKKNLGKKIWRSILWIIEKHNKEKYFKIKFLSFIKENAKSPSKG